MIDNYSFIDANSSGNKEAFISGNKVAYNKLSANETNLIKDKLNEIIGQVNLNQIPLYPNFSLKFKGENNIMLNQLQAGDIVHGFYDENTIWTNARYNGGDVTDKANYTNLDEGVVTRIEKFSDLYLGSSTFTLPTFAQIIEVSVNGWSTENYTTPNDTTVIINETISTGQQVVILYLVDENSNIAPYYTQAQTDALIAGGATTTDILPLDLVFLDLEDNPLPYTLTLLDGFKYTLGNYGFIELSLESSVTSVHNYFFKITIDNIFIPNNIIALGSVFNDIGDSYSISIFKLSNNSIYILSPNPSPEIFNKLTISLKYKII
jgi:hypothetical protein